VSTMRSGRPLEYDKNLISDYDKWNCVPVYDKDLPYTYLQVNGLPLDGSSVKLDGVVPLRAGAYDACGAHGDCGEPSKHMTMVFHTFVFLQVFNEINARKLHNEFNVFKGVQHHFMFIAVFIGTLAVQFILVEVPGINTTFKCTNLDPWMHLFCLLAGASELLWNILVHFLPYEWISLGAWAGSIDEAQLDELTEIKEEDTQKS
jgi:hypothetical protein